MDLMHQKFAGLRMANMGIKQLMDIYGNLNKY